MRGKAPADPSALIGEGLGRASGYIYAAISHPITSGALKRRRGAAGKLNRFHSTSGEPHANNCWILELGDIKQDRLFSLGLDARNIILALLLLLHAGMVR